MIFLVVIFLLNLCKIKLRSFSISVIISKFRSDKCFVIAINICAYLLWLLKIRKLIWFLNFIEINYNASLSHKEKNIQCFKQFWNWRLQIFNSFSCNCWFQSFTIPDRFISAQFPLPDYTEDFLRLVEAYYTPTIVSLCPLMEVESVYRVSVYLQSQ